eukprot:1139891-Pelagomonas_calceolata.AAC.3
MASLIARQQGVSMLTTQPSTRPPCFASPRLAPRINSHQQALVCCQGQRWSTGRPEQVFFPSRVVVRASSAEQQQQQQQEADDQVAWDENHEPGETVEVVPGKVIKGGNHIVPVPDALARVGMQQLPQDLCEHSTIASSFNTCVPQCDGFLGFP